MAFTVTINAGLLLFIVGMLVASNVTFATLYHVGDSDGNWTVPSKANNLDYTTWAASKTFNFGDELHFNYNNDSHNVLLVNSTAYQTCDYEDDPLVMWESGNDVIELNLNYVDYYFICGKPTHCTQGQKFHVSVSALAASPPTGNQRPPSSAMPSGSADALPEPAVQSLILVMMIHIICILHFAF